MVVNLWLIKTIWWQISTVLQIRKAYYSLYANKWSPQLPGEISTNMMEFSVQAKQFMYFQAVLITD